MHPLKECYRLTTEIIHMLENEQAGNRDEIISTLQEKLRIREEIIKKIIPPFSDGEKILGQQLVLLNHQLENLLNKERNAIRQEFINVKKRKNVKTGYINPYASLQTDGYFYDKRK